MAREQLMRRYVAFLRAINVGGHVVRMEQLRQLFAAMGFSDVETFIASGNVIFRTKAADAAALERQIEMKLGKALGYPVGVFLRTIEEVHAIAAHRPFDVGEGGEGAAKVTVYVILLKAPPTSAERKQVLAFSSEADGFAFKDREIYWCRRGSMLESAFSTAKVEKNAPPTTMRNRNTMVRLAAKYKI
jgi:uncharacterized protein (DUF1697 family)